MANSSTYNHYSASKVKNILITGGSGLLGRHLVKKFQNKGHQVAILSRNPKIIKGVSAFYWNPEKHEIDDRSLIGVNIIIHLAGESIARERWTDQRKQQIIASRVSSIALLYKVLRETNMSVEAVISASAVGYYGDRGDELLHEESGQGVGFLADCCRKWEDAVDEGSKMGYRVVKLRIGLLLTKEGGALVAFERLIRNFIGTDLGSGRQWYPWIHLDDLLEIFVKSIENTTYQGAYNACAPFPVRNHEFMRELGEILHRPIWPINVNKLMLRVVLGEKSILVLMSTNTSSRRLEKQGYHFKYRKITDALNQIYRYE